MSSVGTSRGSTAAPTAPELAFAVFGDRRDLVMEEAAASKDLIGRQGRGQRLC
jgi:hypothetical protein